MKPNSSSFLENRIFDQRLVKENLVDKWNLYGDIYKTRSDYRQFLDSYVKFIFIQCFFFLYQFRKFSASNSVNKIWLCLCQLTVLFIVQNIFFTCSLQWPNDLFDPR